MKFIKHFNLFEGIYYRKEYRRKRAGAAANL